MSKNKLRPPGKKPELQLHIFSRQYPLLFYIVKWFFITALIGACTGTISAAFLRSLDWVTTFREAHIWVITFLPVSGFAIGLLYYYKGKNVEGGNNIVIATIDHPHKKIPFRMAPFVYLGTMATHFFGGSAGRAGTAIQMSSAIADQFSKPFKLAKEDRKILIIAAVAAGFGSVFGTPLAGAVFALEVAIAGRIKYNAILPAFAAAFTADLVTRLWHTQHTIYHIDIVPPLSVLHLLYAVAAGIFFGLCAAAFTRGMHGTSALFRSIIKYPPLQPLVAGIIVALAVWAIGSTKYIGLGIPTMLQAFNEHLPGYDFLLKIAFTIVTLAAGFKGGEVTPLFFIGAVLGNALSYFIPLPMGLLAGMGFVAVFAGATNTPLACAVMAMELFGSQCGVFVAIACITAYLFSGDNSIYHAQKRGGKFSRYFLLTSTETDLKDL